MTDDQERHDISELMAARPHRAEIAFAVLSFLFALLLATQIGNELTWVARLRFVAQPGFWPVVAIAGMLLFGAFELWFTWQRMTRNADGSISAELLHWARSLEYVAWFLAYVLVVPITGYLPTTIVFCVALAWRLGYRGARTLFAAVVVAVAVVVVFKSFLSVRIPGGAVYEYLPGGLRNFMILNF